MLIMATDTNEEYYYQIGEEVVRFLLRNANLKRGPISPADLKDKLEKVTKMIGILIIRTKLTVILWFVEIHY